MKWKYNEPKHEDIRIITRFLLLPKFINGEARWLCLIKIKQRYEGYNWADDGWQDIGFVN